MPGRLEPVRLEPAKASDLAWFDLDALPELVVPPELDVLRAVRSDDVPAILTFGFVDRPVQ